MPRSTSLFTTSKAALLLLGAVLLPVSTTFSDDKGELPSLRRLLEESKPGDWVKMKNPNGLVTRMLAAKKEGQTLYVEMHTLRNDKPQEWQQQVIDIPNQKVVTARFKYADGQIDEIPGDQIEAALQGYENYRYVGEEKVKVPAGAFLCKHYRAVVQDRLIHVWLSDEVPLTKIVKTTFQGGSSVLLEFGSGGVAPAFE